MKKAWHNPREVTVHQVQPELEDHKRLERLVVLLATGMERRLAAQNTESTVLLDFTPSVSPNTTNVNEPVKTENQ